MSTSTKKASLPTEYSSEGPTAQAADPDALPSRPNTYRVKTVFRTLQGEGAHAGRPAVFVRFTGCNMWSGYESDRQRDAERNDAHCPLWCDTDFTKDGATTYTAEELVEATLRAGALQTGFVVCTGGEPLLQVDSLLMRTFHRHAGLFVAVETNGTVPLANVFTTEFQRVGTYPGFPDWIVCSPKLPEDRLHLEAYDELKLVVPDYTPDRYRHFATRAKPHDLAGHRCRYLWLQPEDGPRQQAANARAVKLAHRHPDWRVSVQTHKVLGLD